MTQETITRIKLTASTGYVLTNGEAFGKEVYLGTSDSPENWYEITEAEYEEILNSEDLIIEDQE